MTHPLASLLANPHLLHALPPLDYGLDDLPDRSTGAWEDCESCSFAYYATLRARIARTGEGITTEMQNNFRKNSNVMKRKGEPCARCKDNSPKGTYPWNGASCIRLRSDSGESTVLHGSGCQCLRASVVTESAA